MGKYEVKITKKVGSMDNSLFEKMATKGDITSIKVTDILGQVVKIIGYAECEIITEDKNFTMNYFDTEEYGIISSGSEIFRDSVIDYYEEVDRVRITEIKTKKGKTYKAVPELNSKKNETKTENKEQETSDDLPF
jgi:hypothetical protein